MIELRPLSEQDMETVRVWRHGSPETLRTPYMLTKEMQQQYYRDVICNRESHTRYWGLWWTVPNITHYEYGKPVYGNPTWEFCGYGGLENIHGENGNAEISLLIGPEYRKKGYGREAVKLFLQQGFDVMRLHSVYGECYTCGSVGFWQYLFPLGVFLGSRKYFNGEHYGSYYFTAYRENYENLMRDTSEGNKQAATGQEHEGISWPTYDTVRDRCGTSDYIHGCGIE